ncbi:MAG: GNAT family N-acetyltransferase [Alistipes sp.]|nr:GNAT family N-acetyltransferase [Alistipes sp.]
MVLLKDNRAILRSVDFSDIDTLLLWENANNEPLYGIFKERYTRKNVELFVMLQMQYTIEQTEQMRLMICTHEGERLGSIDLTDYDGRKAFVSILIFEPSNRRKGFGESALRMVVEYAKKIGLRSLYAHILPDNLPSINLFEKVGFEGDGTMLYRKRL